MKKLAFVFALGLLLTTSAQAQTGDISQPVNQGNSYTFRIQAGTAPAGEVVASTKQLCLLRVDVTPVEEVVCFMPAAPATEFPQGFIFDVTLTYTASLDKDPEFRAVARNNDFDPQKESELSANKLTLVWPVPASPVLQP